MIFDKGNSLQNSTLNIFHVKAKKLIFFPLGLSFYFYLLI